MLHVKKMSCWLDLTMEKVLDLKITALERSFSLIDRYA